MENFQEESLQKGHRTAVLIAGFMIASVFVYAGIVEYFTRSSPPFAGFSPIPAEIFNKLRFILLGVSLLDLALIPFLRNRALSAQNRPGMPPMGRLLTSLMISFALCESIVIYGFILFLLNGARPEFYLFFCLSLMAFAVHFPSYERWRNWSQRMRDSVD